MSVTGEPRRERPAAHHAPADRGGDASDTDREARSAGSYEFVLPDPPATDEAAVDEALEPLHALPDRPVAEHVEIYAEVHRRLHDVLTDLDPGDVGDAGEGSGSEG